jgi:gliding motility-associated-like protein
MVMIKKFTFFLIIFFMSIVVRGQFTMTNNSASVYCAAGSVVWINGTLHNIGDSLYNLGKITVAGEVPPNAANEGDLINDGKISGDGKYYVAGHWINNNTFKCGTSEVILDNTPGSMPSMVANQEIRGTQNTAFYDLTFIGIGIKKLMLDDTVKHFLNLNDREYDLAANTCFVTNTDPLAITRTSGFVSNLTDGWLNRSTDVIGPYLYPMGSSGGPSAGPMRYRPVVIKPLNAPATPTQYKVGYFNYLADNDGYDIAIMDGTFCRVNPLFYHKIDTVNQLGNADITIYYDPVTDMGPWDGMANWRPIATGPWTNMAPVSTIYSPMRGIVKSNWSTWTDDPYALIARTPDSIGMDGATEYCMGSGPTSYSAYGDPNDTYVWTITGGYFVGDATHNIVNVVWDTPGIGVLTVQEIISWSFCVSNTSHFYVTVYPEPIANFQVVPSDTIHIFTYDLIHFVDLSINAVQWQWDFGEGSPSSQQSPYHIYSKPGFYNVCLVISSADDCVDDTCMVVEVIEGIEIPNVFTPNGDGFNDVFNIKASGITQFDVQVFNRWGALIFESNSPNVKWDGTSVSGEQAADGTYFYILNAKSDAKDYSQHGYVTLLRH